MAKDDHPRLRPATRLLLLACLAFATACGTVPTPPPVEDKQDPHRDAPIERDPSTVLDNDIDMPGQSAAAIDSLLAAADTAHDRRDYVGAIAHLERAIRIDPRNSSLWVRLSREHLSNGDDAAASQHARKAIALAGQDPWRAAEAWLALADVYEAQGRTEEAFALRQRYRTTQG